MSAVLTDRHAPDAGAITAVVQAQHGDPFAVLGPHEVEGGCAIRSFIPGAIKVEVLSRESGQKLGDLSLLDSSGFWSGVIPAYLPYRLRVTRPDSLTVVDDAYAFGPALGDVDIYLLAEGRHREIGGALGAHLTRQDGVDGTRFAVWAPNARRVSVVGSFNDWDGRRHPMRFHPGGGVWEMFIPGVTAGAVYKYEILGPQGWVLPLKADPVASAAQIPPATASIVTDDRFIWTDHDWMETKRSRANAHDAPIAVYEVHAGSWAPQGGDYQDIWSELAEKLVPYVVAMGFTHVEFMPVMEHPFGGSWGYQPLGQFAPSARWGSPDNFAKLVDRFHASGIAVILDWVPAHFPGDAHGLAQFDGTSLYEHADPKEGFHQDWNTYIYNLGRNEVRGFLIGSALHWLEKYHIDALRVDAVASMLYRDYSRKQGEWVPNMYGGRENLEAISFIRELSEVVAGRCAGAALMAEESTAFPGVSRPVSEGGLGFDYKWNMGWMHDTLHYMQEDSINRRWHHDQIAFGLVYAFSENFILPLSHDEVVYGKGSLIQKMSGDHWQKFANLRAYFGFMWTHPGKKLIFMGGEFAQEREWDHDHPLDWFLLDRPDHAGVQLLLSDLNGVYRSLPALHRRDSRGDGFQWVVLHDSDHSVFAYLRYGEEGDKPVLVVCNLTPVPRQDYRLGVPRTGGWREVLNTDAERYGGSNLGNGGWINATEEGWGDFAASLTVTLPPLATVIFEAA
ncbi:1,4-alpha-glucan branching protein GlgB [Acidisoma silvae]|uniref:1,4-alpha-glucan branching enzyme GlgB n=1 Tax=Acidisoma silvae TaxID=2802396 RepID=A0A964DYN7_9PROT|nr:1,4-alpha-glucan branching protein GlgB [Acidisoma silvae]MCB8875252.1 1,4-alpha-glucan branching protein GlgB [Acidisoma silvae]